jgi:hypothetical protein
LYASLLQRELEHLQKMQKNFWDALLDNLLPWRVWWRVRTTKVIAALQPSTLKKGQ